MRIEKLRVVAVVPAIAEEASGPSYSVVKLCEALTTAGTVTKLAALDWAPLASPPPMLRTFKLGRGPAKLGRSPAMCRWLKNEVRGGRVDVLHSHVLWQMNSIYPSWAVRGTRVKLVASPRGSLSEWAMASGSRVKRLFWPLLQRRALERADCIHVTSLSEYEDVRRMGFRQPVAVVPNGVDLPGFPHGDGMKEREVLYLGRLHPTKGVGRLLRVWKRLEDQFQGWRLTIAGPASGYDGTTFHSDSLRQLALDLRLERARFIGPAYGTEKFELYRRASVFVLPTHSENFGITVAEAQASGTAAIVTKGAPWEGLETNRSGWWVGNDEDAIHAALREAMSCSLEELSEMGMRGRSWMERDFGWKEIGTKMRQTYEWLCGTGERPGCVVLD